MRKIISKLLLVLTMPLIAFAVSAQSSTVVSGTVKNGKTNETVSAVSVTIKGSNVGTFTDDKGAFKFTTVQKPPFTLVISSVGFASKEVSYNGSNLNINIDATYSLGDEVVVAASRVPERIMESPVSIERVNAATIRNAPAMNYYDVLGHLKGVDVTTASLTFNSISTRGFNSSGNIRLNQLVDGMDNQAPGLNFSVGSIIGLTDLDVDNMELLSGASSALYGSGGMNGTLLINSKNPFKYQGLSFQIKQGINHVDNYQRPANLVTDWSVRWGKKVSEKFAFKIGAEFMQAKDWLANDQRDYKRAAATGYPFGQVVSGDRNSDPNYDGVNVYGDETSTTLTGVRDGVYNGVKAAVGVPTFNNIYAASGAFLTANPSATLAQFNTFLTGIGGGSLVAGGYSPFFYGDYRGYYAGMSASRTGYNERDVVDPNTVNAKLSGGLYYKLSSKVEASLTANWGTGNTVYTGSDRYSLKNLKMGQYKLEVKAKDWFIRGWMTKENSGDSYNVTIATRLFNEAWMPSTSWFPLYTNAYTQALAAGASVTQANMAARAAADATRPTGSVLNDPRYRAIIATPIGKSVAGMPGIGGAQFLDRTSLYTIEGQYNLTDALGLAKSKTEFIVGGAWKRYWLDSQGTLFADKSSLQPGKIKIDETGAYAQLTQRLFSDVLKLGVSGRYDKQTNFEGRFTPRATAVVTIAKDQNIRLSYQQAYRFPTTQNQWINLNVSSGIYLIGGIQPLIDYYSLNTNPVYNAAGQVIKFNALKPEKSSSYEIGYKGLFMKKLLIDAYAYWATYDDFITATNGLQLATGRSFSVAQNAVGTVKTNGWGISADYLLPANFVVGANVYSDQISDKPSDPNFVSYFNTPKTRYNISFGNTGFLIKKRIGFNVIYKWQDSFYYEGSFGVGNVPSFGIWDAQATYKITELNSAIKFGASNLFNKYYTNGFGNAQVGGLYYVSFGYNIY